MATSDEHGDSGVGGLSVTRRIVPPAEREVSILPPADLSYYTPQSPDFVLQLLPPGLNRVLDVGCGTGKLGGELKARGVAEVVGVESVPEAAELARAHLDRVFVGDIEELDIDCPDGYFDAIVYSGVLEHLVDPHFELFRRRRLLRSGGVVAALLPNVQHFTVVMELLSGRWTLQSAGEMDATHLRWFTLHEIRRMFAAAGFAVEDVRGHVFGTHPAAYQQMIDAVAPLGLMNPDFSNTTDVYIYTLRAQKVDDWKPAARAARPAGVESGGLFTGERAMPLAANMDGAVMREHWARYQRVLPLVRGKVVLDVACGAGYGSDLLAQSAARVIGGDVDAGAIAYSSRHYDRPNLTFAAMDVRNLPLGDKSVDAVVSFETLEHVVEGEQFLAEVTRVLRPDGTLAISVPLGGRAGNPFHLAYYQRGTLVSYLAAFFDDVEIVYQQGDSFSTESASPTQAPVFTGEYALALCRSPRHRARDLTSIVILTYNGLDLTRDCLESIHRCTPEPHEIIVVDNGSSDGTLAWLRDECAGRANLRVVANDANLGFAAGNNQGLAIAQGEYAVLLNNDTLVTEGWLGTLLAHLRSRPELGIVGPVSNRVSGPQQVPNANYGGPEQMRYFARKWAKNHRGQLDEASRLVGFCLALRRGVVDRIGGLDERFGSGNFEDDDFCLRALAAGYTLGIARECYIHHIGGQTFKAAGIDFSAAMLRNWGVFKAKWGLPADLDLATPVRVSVPGGDLSAHFVPLPRRDAVPEVSDPLPEAAAALERADVEGAVSLYALAAARYPASLEARQGLAAALVGCGRLVEAAETVRGAIALAPAGAALRNFLGVILYQTGDLEGAESAFGVAHDLEPRDVTSLLNLVDITRSQQRYEEATAYLGEALRTDAGHPDALAALAGISLELGDCEAAAVALRRLEDVAPDHPELPALSQFAEAARSGDLATA